jgi:hypothetical protein
MHLVGFEPPISAGERPKTYALDRAAAGTGPIKVGAVCKYQHHYFRGFKKFRIFICGMLPTDILMINEIRSQKLLGESLWNTEFNSHIHETPPLEGSPELCELSLHTHTHSLKALLMLSPIDIL